MDNTDVKITTAEKRSRDRTKGKKRTTTSRATSPLRGSFGNHGRYKPYRIQNVAKAVGCTFCNPKPTNRLIRQKLSVSSMQEQISDDRSSEYEDGDFSDAEDTIELDDELKSYVFGEKT